MSERRQPGIRLTRSLQTRHPKGGAAPATLSQTPCLAASAAGLGQGLSRPSRAQWDVPLPSPKSVLGDTGPGGTDRVRELEALTHVFSPDHAPTLRTCNYPSHRRPLLGWNRWRGMGPSRVEPTADRRPRVHGPSVWIPADFLALAHIDTRK